MIHRYETHPLEPFLPENVKIVIIGFFPPDASVFSMDFYYPAIDEDFWRILGQIFYDDCDYFLHTVGSRWDKDRIVSFLQEKRIGIMDLVQKCRIFGSSMNEENYEILEILDIVDILEKYPTIDSLCFTGIRTYSTFRAQFCIDTDATVLENIFQRPVRLSPMLYLSHGEMRPFNYAEKLAAYRALFRKEGIVH